MYNYPELTFMVATEHQRQRIADAERYRLLARARRSRRAARAGRRQGGMSAPAGTLAPCAPAAA